LEMIWAILHCLQVQDHDTLSRIWAEVLQSGMLKKELHDRMNNIEAYDDLIMDLATRSGMIQEGQELSTYIRTRYESVRSKVESAPKPRVYYAMGHPLFAINPGRFEGRLVEAAGGEYVNKAIGKEGKPGINISREEMMGLNPEFIFTSGFISSSVSDTSRYCMEHTIDVPAVREGNIYSMHPTWDFGSPRWILGLMTIANILHPDRCQFDIEDEAHQFYTRFYGIPYKSVSPNRSFAQPGVLHD
ncbi:MAG: Radical SAM domain protein, partial [Methanomicrobiales archaeon 53_19]